MLDRQKIETLLSRRFPGAARDQIAAAANGIMGLDDEWEEVKGQEEELGRHVSVPCRDACYLARQLERRTEFRLLLRRAT